MTAAIEVTESRSRPETSLGVPLTGGVGTGSSEVAVRVAVSDGVQLPPSTTRLGPPELYSDDSLLSHVLSLVQRAKSALQQALNFDPVSDFTQFEQGIMASRALIERALTCREIGTGFTTVVNATSWALANREPGFPTRRQLNTLIEALSRISWSPYLHFDTAMSILDSMEEVDLNIESPALELITAELND